MQEVQLSPLAREIAHACWTTAVWRTISEQIHSLAGSYIDTLDIEYASSIYDTTDVYSEPYSILL